MGCKGEWRRKMGYGGVLSTAVLLVLLSACSHPLLRGSGGRDETPRVAAGVQDERSRPASVGSTGQPLLVPPRAGAPSWEPSRLTLAPGLDSLGYTRVGQPGLPRKKFSLRFYQKLRSHLTIAPLADVDIWDLRFHPRRYDIITIGPLSVRQFSGRKELLEDLAAPYGVSREKAQVLTNWVKSGGIVWIEFGVFIQRYEVLQQEEGEPSSLPNLTGFTIFGLPTRAFVFAAQRRDSVTFLPRTYSFHNEARHEVSADIQRVQLVQSDVQTVYPIIDSAEGELIRERGNVYARVVNFGEGKIVSMVPFDDADVDADGEKFRLNLREWLAGFPVPSFEPTMDINRAGD